MKKLLFLSAIVISSSQLPAQDTSNIAAIKNQIDSLEKRLDEANYVRVPRKDLEDHLNNAIHSEVSDSILKWMGGLATLIGLFGFAIASYFKGQVKDEVEKAYNSKIKQMEADLKNDNLKQDNKLKELTERIDKLIENQANFFNESSTTIDKKLKEALSFVWDDVAESKFSRAKERGFKGKDLIQGISLMLENKSIELKDEQRILLIDGLMRCYYYTPGESGERQDKNMIELLRKYEAQFELLPETYANAAIALRSSYELYGVKPDRNACIESCDKSISQLQDYGTSYAIKLEVFMMDYKKAFDDKEQQMAVENTERTFNAIKTNQSKALCFEIIERLFLDRSVSYLKPYIELLEKMFSDRLLEVKERACSDVITNHTTVNDERYINIINKILNEDLKKSPVLDGDWVCSKMIENGKEITIENDSEILSLDANNYSRQIDGTVEKGLVHFLPYTQTAGIDFYQDDGEYYNKKIPGIYKLENGQLIICTNNQVDEKPSEFLSTPENTIYYYNKALDGN